LDQSSKHLSIGIYLTRHYIALSETIGVQTPLNSATLFKVAEVRMNSYASIASWQSVAERLLDFEQTAKAGHYFRL